MKIRETRENSGGARGPRTEFRIFEAAPGESLPDGAEEVAAETPVSEWHPEPLPTESPTPALLPAGHSHVGPVITVPEETKAP